MTFFIFFKKQKIPWLVKDKYFYGTLYTPATKICIWINVIKMKHKKAKKNLFRYRHIQAIRVPEVWGSRFFRYIYNTLCGK
jgi:hypothetical protein